MAASLVALPARGAEPLDEIGATRRICSAGPAVALARAERLRGDAEVTAADVLPNPTFELAHQQAFGAGADRETIVGLSVPLGIGGRRFMLQDAAAARRDQAFAVADATLFESALAFRETYLAALLAGARVAILSEHQQMLDELSTTIQSLAKGGEAAGYEHLRQQVQARTHRRALDAARARAAAARARVEAWIGGEVLLPPLRLGSVAGGSPAPVALAQETPRIRSLEAEARASAFDAEAARRRWVPDVELFAGYRTVTGAGDTGHGFSVGLTVPLTFFDHGQGEAARADAQAELARATAGETRRRQRAERAAATAQLEALEAAMVDAAGASGDALALHGKARQLYAAGEASITELLDAFRAAEEARLAELALAEEIVAARIARMRAAGTMFDGALDRACQAGAP